MALGPLPPQGPHRCQHLPTLFLPVPVLPFSTVYLLSLKCPWCSGSDLGPSPQPWALTKGSLSLSSSALSPSRTCVTWGCRTLPPGCLPHCIPSAFSISPHTCPSFWPHFGDSPTPSRDLSRVVDTSLSPSSSSWDVYLPSIPINVSPSTATAPAPLPPGLYTDLPLAALNPAVAPSVLRGSPRCPVTPHRSHRQTSPSHSTLNTHRSPRPKVSEQVRL